MSLQDDNINIHTKCSKSHAIAALAWQFVLLAGAAVFYKERMLFSDAPHILFRILNQHQLQIAENRYGSFVTQLFPYIGSALHLSLKSIALLYSLSFNLFFTVGCALMIFRYKRYDLAILLTLYLTLFVSDTYFWTNNEVHQGITWLLIAFAICTRLKLKGYSALIQAPVFILLFGLAIWTHPLVMLIALFLWFFYWAGRIRWPYSTRESIVYSIVLLTLAYLKFYQGAHHGYDSGKIETVTQLQPDHIRHILSAPQLHFFIKSCVTNYWLAVLLAIGGVGALLYAKKYALAVYTISAAVGYILLLSITYWGEQGRRFYMESEYMPLTIICCAPFVYYLLPRIKWQYGVAILLLVPAIRVGYIYHSSTLFTNRVALINNISSRMQARQITKAIITTRGNESEQALLMSWGTPVESIVAGKMNNMVPQRTFLIADEQQLKTFYTASNDTLLGCFEKVPASHLNAAYFKIDTTTGYRIIEWKDLMK